MSRLARTSFCLTGLLGLLVACAREQETGDAEPRTSLRSERVATLLLDDVWPRRKPDESVELYFRALSPGRVPVEGLGRGDLLVRQDDARIDSDDTEVQTLEEAKRGSAVVLALDLSPTMAQPFEAMRRAAHDFTERVTDYDRVGVLGFAGSVDEVGRFTASRSDLHQDIDALQSSSDPSPTRLYDSLYRAVESLRKAQDLPRRAAVIVFTDGQDGGSQHSLEDVLELAKGDGDRPRVLFYGIGYPTGFGESGLPQLERLARETTGDYWRVEPGAPLTDAYSAIWKQLKQSYVLRFATDLDGQSHGIQLVAQGEAKDERRAVPYPEVGSRLLPWLVGGLGVALLAAGVGILLLLRRAGSLEFQSGAERGERAALRRGLNRIGSGKSNEIVIPHDTVSKKHAEVEVHGRGAVLRDLGSSNGTFVNDIELQGEHVLQPGDRVRFADVDTVYRR